MPVRIKVVNKWLYVPEELVSRKRAYTIVITKKSGIGQPGAFCNMKPRVVSRSMDFCVSLIPLAKEFNSRKVRYTTDDDMVGLTKKPLFRYVAALSTVNFIMRSLQKLEQPIPALLFQITRLLRVVVFEYCMRHYFEGKTKRYGESIEGLQQYIHDMDPTNLRLAELVTLDMKCAGPI